MDTIKKAICGTIFGALAVVCIVLLCINGHGLNQLQIDTSLVLLCTMSVSVLYCFIVGEITCNNSQMDKLWSILPIIYTWVIAIMGHMQIRLIIMAVLATIWGVRLTYNFAKKGAYSIKFWTGEEDYRWVVLRNNKLLKPRWKWAIFDLLFISIYQNALVLLTVIPGVIAMDAANSFNWIDIVAIVCTLGFIIYEATADAQQMKFQTKKWDMIKSGMKLEELPEPYNKGFNTFGLWNYSRHPNYCGEQGTWLSFYIFSIAAGAAIFNYSFFGAAMLVLLFIGSSTFQEAVTKSKYPEYAQYCKKTFSYLPCRKYRK